MPNWCENYIEVSGNPKSLHRYIDDVHALQTKQRREHDALPEKEKKLHDLADENWARNLFAKYLDDKANQEHNDGNINIRGSINCLYINEEENKLIINVDTAWSGTVEGFNNYLLERYKDICVTRAYEVETGMQVFTQYQSNADDTEKMININFSKEKEDYYYDNYGDKTIILEDLNADLKTNYKSLDDLIKAEEKKGAEIDVEDFCIVSLPQCEHEIENSEDEVEL